MYKKIKTLIYKTSIIYKNYYYNYNLKSVSLTTIILYVTMHQTQ